MKQTLLFLVLALGMCSINIKAQEKTYKVEDDGFEWYNLYDYSNGGQKEGAQDKYGNTIIPLQKDISVYYSHGSFIVKNSITKLEGATDKQGNLIVPVEYNTVYSSADLTEPYIPYIMVEKDGYKGVYNIYGKCIIPINRRYKRILYYSDYYRCYYDADNGYYTICDASGKVVFTPSKSYQSIWLIRDEASGKCALAVTEKDRKYFINKENKVLWNPNNIVEVSDWPIEIRTSKNGPWRRLTQAELNRILLSEDLLKGNKEYLSEYPIHKKGDKPSSNSTASSNAGSNSSNNPGGGTTTVVVEHHRDQVPVQEWQQCTNCGGAGKLGCTGCGGSGTIYIGDNLRKCHYCNGYGEQRCNFCAGKGGQYVTVYR